MTLLFQFVLTTILVTVAIISCMIIYLICQYSLQTIQYRQKHAYRESVASHWYHYLIDGQAFPPELHPTKTIELRQTEEILSSYLVTVKSDDLMQVVSDFANNHLTDFYREVLKHRKWSIRMNALKYIGDFQIHQLLDDCKQMLKRPKLSTEEFFELIHIFSIIDQVEFMLIFPDVEKEFSEYEYKKLLIDLPQENLDQLIKIRTTLSSNCQYVMFDIIAFHKNPAYIPFLESNLSSTHSEIRIRALKALIEMGQIENIKLYEPFINSDNVVERLMVTRILGKIPSAISCQYLEQLQDDNNWSVRQEVEVINANYQPFQSSIEESKHVTVH